MDGNVELSEVIIDSLRVSELRAELHKRGLPGTGFKVDLVARLKASLTPGDDIGGAPHPPATAAPTAGEPLHAAEALTICAPSALDPDMMVSVPSTSALAKILSGFVELFEDQRAPTLHRPARVRFGLLHAILVYDASLDAACSVLPFGATVSMAMFNKIDSSLGLALARLGEIRSPQNWTEVEALVVGIRGPLKLTFSDFDVSTSVGPALTILQLTVGDFRSFNEYLLTISVTGLPPCPSTHVAYSSNLVNAYLTAPPAGLALGDPLMIARYNVKNFWTAPARRPFSSHPARVKNSWQR